MSSTSFEVRYKSEMFGTTALHSQHGSPAKAEQAANDFKHHVLAQRDMDPRSKGNLFRSIHVTLAGTY